MLFVTGATGKSGRHFLDYLAKDEHYAASDSVRIFTRSPNKLSNFPWQIAKGDLESVEDLTRAMSGCDTVMHIAGIRFSLNVVRAAVANKIPNLIFVHTTGIFSKYKSASAHYQEIEAEIRKLIHGTGMKLSILRPTMIYGTLDDGTISVFMKMVDRLKFFPIVDHARFELQPVFYQDLSHAYYRLLKSMDANLGRDYNLSGQEPICLIDILKTIANELGRRPIFINVPFPIAYALAWMLFIASFGRIDFREKVQRLVEPRTFSHDAATRDLGYSPVNFQTGIKSEAAAYRSR